MYTVQYHMNYRIGYQWLTINRSNHREKEGVLRATMEEGVANVTQQDVPTRGGIFLIFNHRGMGIQFGEILVAI